MTKYLNHKMWGHLLGIKKCNIIAKPPSAGLVPWQTEEDELKITYEELKQAPLEMICESGNTTTDKVRARVEELIAKAGHKNFRNCES